jgi:hypothetical protein
MSRNKNFCFTINNYNEESIANLRQIRKRYLIFSKEIAPTTGTPHLQGYIQMETQMTIRGLTRKIPKAAIFIAKGTVEENQIYIRKNNNEEVHEEGEPTFQGNRTDLEEIRELVMKGTTMLDICRNCATFQGLRYAEHLFKYLEKERNWKPVVHWYYGKSGSGKTKTAIEQLTPSFYTCPDNLKFMEGYDGQENVLLDELRESTIPYHHLLKLLDRYPYRVEVKGSSRQFLAKKIIITSQFHPSKTYNNGEDPFQLLRRIDLIRHFGPVPEDETLDILHEL